MFQNQFRISKYLMCEVFETNTNIEFGVISGSNKNQYVVENQLQSTVVHHLRTLNKLHSNNSHIDYSTLTKETKGSLKLRMMLREGFPWNERTFGYLVNVRDLKTGDMLFAGVFKSSDVHVNPDFTLIDNNYWTGYVDYLIPKVRMSQLAVSVFRITFDEINYQHPDGDGRLYTYPSLTDYVPLISSNPIPDFIGLDVELDSNMYLSFGITTTENKSVQQSIIDYFEEKLDSQISVEYQVDYGNTTVGFQSFRISNNFSKFAKVKFLPDYQPNQEIDIYVTMQVKVNEKLMERQVSLRNIDTSFVMRLTEFENLEINHISVDVQQVSQPNYDIKYLYPKQAKVIEKIQTVYIRNVVTDNSKKLELKQSGRVITFDNLKLENVQLQFIDAKDNVIEYLNPYKTSDDVWYYDCRLLSLPPKVKYYRLLNMSNNELLQTGEVKL